MTVVRRFVLSAALMVQFLPQFTFAQDKSSCNDCSVVQQALFAAKGLDPGKTRADVEANFEMDGGLQTTDTVRYVFKNCRAIQILVRFEGDEPGRPAAALPTDRIVTVSRPYLEYQAMD